MADRGATLKFQSGLAKSDPWSVPVLIVGQQKDLSLVPWASISPKLEPRVTEELWLAAVSGLSTKGADAVSLSLNKAVLLGLPGSVSRHNTPSRGHSISKHVRAASSGAGESVVLVCRREDMYASGCAVARAYSSYNLKTSDKEKGASFEVGVEFIMVEDGASTPASLTTEDIKLLESSCSGIQLAARLVDTPCNVLNTSAFVEEAKLVAKELGIVPTIIEGEDLEKQGFGGLYGVGKAAVHPPALVVLSHTPPTSQRVVAWVGKGIVYDTGGLSIKDKTGMPGMKRDCGGAAGILAAFKVAVLSGFQDSLHCVLCLAENSVGPIATRPDDIHTMYSGKTVEINNTDAEGRLVLGDGVAYAKKDLKADFILDMATLTGAQGVATGKYHASFLTNAAAWEEKVAEAGRSSGDLAFPAVFCPELQFPEFKSAVADMKNSVADRSNASPSCAGLFIFSHIGFDWSGTFVHVDMAAPVHVGERATGYGVALLNTLFGERSGADMLRNIGPKVEAVVNGDASQASKKMRVG